MSISMRVNDKEKKLIQEFANFYGMSVSEYIRYIVMEKIEDEYDLKCAEEAHEEFLKDPVTYTLDEVIERYGKPEEV